MVLEVNQPDGKEISPEDSTYPWFHKSKGVNNQLSLLTKGEIFSGVDITNPLKILKSSLSSLHSLLHQSEKGVESIPPLWVLVCII